ncbi:aminotransferase class I/II-fold pyridoxal phosphate-dependent enzyme [Roseburia hominis]
MKRLYEKLEEYSKSDYYGFHMPGHKRNENVMGISLPYSIDITEIEGFDDLHHADGILKEAQARAAAVFGADETHFLVNGSTVGILSGILGCTRRGDKILVARHCHKSIYHAIYLNGLVPRYLYPEFDGKSGINEEIQKKDVENMLVAEPDIRAVVIVSPSYDGVVSDVEGIARVAHAHGIPLIVDEAHGPHFGFHSYFPENSNRLGADVVIHSLHKTLPSLTQTALLHLNGKYADRGKIRMYLDMLQSSSPSYIFMASLDACVDLLERKSGELFDRYAARLGGLRKELGGLRKLHLVQTKHFDRSKLVISVAGTELTSHALYEKLLNDYHLQMEMAAGSYVLAMTSIADTEEGFERLKHALFEIDEELMRVGGENLRELGRMPEETGTYNPEKIARKSCQEIPGRICRQEQIYTPYEIREMQFAGQCEEILWKESAGRISMDFAYLYPPGSPVIVPGERIAREAVELLTYYERQHFRIEGICREGYIRVWKNG